MEYSPESMLYGADGTARLTGMARTQSGAAIWRFSGPGTEQLAEDFKPVLVISHPEILDTFKPAPDITELAGENHYRFRAEFENWEAFDSALGHVNRTYRQDRGAYKYEPALKLGDPVVQYMLFTGKTHFKEMLPADPRVLFFSLRARNSGGAEYPEAAVESDRVLVAGLSDGNGYSQMFMDDCLGEKQLLEAVGKAIVEYNPDVLAGHNAFKGSLSYYLARAKRNKVPVKWGRDNSVVTARKSRAPAAEKQLEYPKVEIAGRSVVDTWFLAQYYDIVKRDLERFDAPYVANYLGQCSEFADPVPQWEYEASFNNSPDLLVKDIENEMAATQVVYRTLIGSYFAQAQMLPLSLQDCIVRGNGMKINYLLMREYLRRGESIPAPAEARFIIGGHTEIRQTGLITDVLNVDMASLYPSIMLKHGVKPPTDTGDVFQPLLSELTSRRLEAKRLAREADSQDERTRHDARQGAFKIFINSFFGYLGTNRMNWADPDRAEFITTTGQKLVKQLAELVEGAGGEVIEIDTDGVYFTAPKGMDVNSEQEREALLVKLNDGLPEGITVELSGYFPAMLSHKIKNYALLGEDGEVTVKGSGMKSRGLEPFLHKFIGDSIRLILKGEGGAVDELYEALKRQIIDGEISINELAKTDTLIESLDVYTDKVEAGARNRAAAYEVALTAKRQLRPGDQASYYITGEKATVKAFEAAKPLRQFDPASPDYNVKYYVKKLDQNLKKVKGFLPEEQAGLFD